MGIVLAYVAAILYLLALRIVLKYCAPQTVDVYFVSLTIHTMY